MASGSSGRTSSGGSKGFDFGSDDVLCSYDDLGNQEAPVLGHRDHVMSTNSGKDFQEGKIGRSSLLHAYNHQEESLNPDLISIVEKSMKKNADNLLRFLEGISSRLSQVELCCYNLDKSMAEMRSDLVQKHNESDSTLRSLEKYLQEVHRYMQILRDKQELAETQKELAKLQLLQKESSSNTHLQPKEERCVASGSDSQKVVSTPGGQNLQLALALPHQVAVSSSLLPRPVEQLQPAPHQTVAQNVHAQVQQASYYPQQNPLPNLLPQTQLQSQDQYLQAHTQYQRSQMHDLSGQAQQPPQPLVSQVTQTQQMVPFSPYPQQWPQQFPQPRQPEQQSPQPQVRPQTTPMYSSYSSTQPANLTPGTFSGSMPMHVSFSGDMPLAVSRAESMAYGYGGSVRTTTVRQSLPPQHDIQRQPQPLTNQSTFGVQVNDSFSGAGHHPPQPDIQRQPQPLTSQSTFGVQVNDSSSGAGHHPPQPRGKGYMMYDDREGVQTTHSLPSHYLQSPQGEYPPTMTHTPLQNPQPPAGGSLLVHHPSSSQMMRSHMYSELIEKAVNIGYGRDHAAAVIHGLEENGQPVDFNSLLRRLNVQSSGGFQRGWSG